jgi:inward rectifier potassium channel
MQQPSFDPGLTQNYGGELQRAIDERGDFNVRRVGISWRDQHPYLLLISASWPKFIAFVFGAFVVTNLLFAGIYYLIGIEFLKGAEAPTAGLRFVNAFFFSTHTLTTVGYGNVYPTGPWANATAAIEALVGLMGFAVVTGLVFGRFSRPSARIAFSENALIAPYQDGWSLQFRVVNRRTNNLIELSARILMMSVEPNGGRLQRKYALLKLEREQVVFFPLTWTIVHPIASDSPLYGKAKEDLQRLQVEIMILIKGFDETFGQTVNVRHSYRHDEIVWGARFTPAFEIDPHGGDLRLEINKISSFEPAPLPRLE